MIKLSLAVFTALIITVLGIEEETILKLMRSEESEFPLDERTIEQELYNFKTLDRSSQLLEIKRKLMQTLGGVNELYRNLGINSLRAKSEVLGILRKVQSVPEEPNEAKGYFRQVSESLNHLITFIPKDVEFQRYGGSPQKPKPEVKPEAEWGHVEWGPPQGEYKPQPNPEWRPPAPKPEPERRPHPPQPEPEREGPYYPPIYPEPEGKKGYLLSAVVSIVRTVKALVLYLI